ncbi:hypothetical protein FB451DRAFT_1193633 [Mycena latifolia]|nr:hypothetical protein FB451DRAFT_1193633 [Mycena latifolia]
MASSSRTGECSAHDKFSKQECDCTHYIESDEIAEYCGNCYHREHFHLNSKPGASQKTVSVTSLLAGILGQDSSAKPSSSRSKPSSSLAAFTSSNKKGPISLSAANRESNRGMRSSSEGGSKVIKKGKEKKRDSSGGDIFKVLSVVVIAGGTEFVKRNGERVLEIVEGADKVPDRVQTQTAVLNGLAVVNAEGIQFDRTASHEGIVEVLADLLPLPFTYFARVQQEAEDDDEPAWCLATPVRNRLVIVPSSHPDGAIFDFNKGNATTSFRNNRIFIVARSAIPADVLREWAGQNTSSFRKPIGSDDKSASEAESGNEDEVPSPERIPAINKRRLFSRSSSDEDEAVEPPKKKQNKASSGQGRKWLRDSSPKTSTFIDLTTDDTRKLTPEFRHPPSTAVKALPSPEKFEPFNDPTLGNPYDRNTTFYF